MIIVMIIVMILMKKAITVMNLGLGIAIKEAGSVTSLIIIIVVMMMGMTTQIYESITSWR